MLLACLLAASAALGPSGLVEAGGPPGVMNYQGVLRDAAGNPLNGTFDMVFRFHDTATLGNEILVDAHEAAGTGGVAVSGGLFNVGLGTGVLSDGAAALPNDPYAALGDVFRDFQDVWLEIQINGETLSPRVKLVSAAYALNAGFLEGRDSSGFLDTSASAQTKPGDLTVADLTLSGGDLSFPGAVPGFTGPYLSSGSTYLWIQAGDENTDSLYLEAGDSFDDGSLEIYGDGTFNMLSGNGVFNFFNGSTLTTTATLDESGNLKIGNDLGLAGSTSTTGPFLKSTTSYAWVLAGDADTDDLHLYAGNSYDDGSLSILGDGAYYMRSGSGTFTFFNGNTLTETASLDGSGNLQIGSDLRLAGSTGATGPFLRGSATSTWLLAGDADTDDLFLYAGNSIDDGSILVYGNDRFELRSGNGHFVFYNMASGVETANLDASGNLQIDGYLDFDLDIDLLDGTSVTTTGSPADLFFNGTNLVMRLGDSAGDTVNVPGNLVVTGTKSFIQNHPLRDDLSIVYVALEGDEAGTYTRGSGRLGGGVARLALGETFAWVTNPEIGLTVQVTPRGAWANLYVESVTTSELVVRGPDGSEAEFDYIVHGLRIGHESHPVVTGRRFEAPVPSMASDLAALEGREELLALTPLERFRRSSAPAASAGAGASAVAGRGPAAEALREAIGTVDVTREEDPLASRTAASTPPPPDPSGLSGSAERAPEEPGGADRAGPGARAASLLDAEGDLRARSFRPLAAELAAALPVGEPVELGDVLVADPERPGRLRVARLESDPAVVGIVSGDPGVLLGSSGRLEAPGERMVSEPSAPQETVVQDGTRRAPVAFSGVVGCKVDAGYGSIRVGDLLTTSATPGHAKRADDPLIGTIVAKALEPLEEGTGRIKVLVMLR